MARMSSVEAHAALVADHGPTLCHLALDSIDHGLMHYAPIAVDLTAVPPLLREPRACFVTLTRQGRIRGCVGTPSAVKPLAEDLVQNAYSAGFRDPHHPPLEARERVDLAVSVAVLSSTEPVRSHTEEALLHALRPGVDGLLISDGRCRALHLPSIWGTWAEPTEFLKQLKRKAGMAPDHWSSSFSAWRFTTASVTLSPDGTVTPSAR
jgi:AmmeMemoRadiSam system protein A